MTEKGQLTEAVTAAEQALALGEELEDALLVGGQQIMLTFAYRDLDDLVRAKAYCEQAMDTYRELGETTLLTTAEALRRELDAA